MGAAFVHYTSPCVVHQSWFKQSRKLRGHVSGGYGRVGKHRKHPGGRGNAGAEHHHRINIQRYHPGYIGKHGMRQFHRVATHHFCKTLNVVELWGLMTEEEQKRFQASGETPVLDVTRAGYRKVLGNGPALTRAFVVRAREFSKLAKEKIEAAGGKCIVIGQDAEACKQH
ncbi:60S ribosomal protein L27a [Gregarina niphandrodes]|uniref:60S ribosomal protein L27a n=1 Tax=Gregarina niphandrodes TaxID=110365 RepID=A0A023AZV4_GRENI|nr:60S ribosomal protein L27a [Gregarina niphandrodes]EZG44117.1 60S ribosomal protein L27a [Gregarina niphandrodes]|eukprot:XP_011132801.1 60S ribosomal protein L27a [Gregarina niphandrodes]